MIPHSWIGKCLEIFGKAENVRGFLADSMQAWKVELTYSGESLGDVNVRGGIFQGYSMSPLLFVLSLMIIPLTLVLRKAKGCYEWVNRHHTVTHISLTWMILSCWGKILPGPDCSLY